MVKLKMQEMLRQVTPPALSKAARVVRGRVRFGRGWEGVYAHHADVPAKGSYDHDAVVSEAERYTRSILVTANRASITPCVIPEAHEPLVVLCRDTVRRNGCRAHR